MDEKIKVLILEDVPDDAELVEQELKKVIQNYALQVTDNEKGFVAALKTYKPDLILSDYTLPQFNGMEAIKLTKEISPLIPVIIVTGSINEEVAVECIKAGAKDYVLKDNLTRLGQAIIQVLEKKALLEARIKAEEALREDEVRYEQIYQFSPDPIIIHDMEMNILDANNKAVEELGYSKEELLQKKMFELHPETELKHSAQVLDAMKNKSKLMLETNFVRKDGSVFLAEATPCKYTLGSKPIIHVVIRDITDRKQAENLLRESEEKYRRVSDNSPAVLYQFMMTPDGGFSFPYVSHRIEGVLGISPEDIMKDPSKLLSKIHPEDMELFREGIMKSSESLSSLPLTFRCIKDGEVIWVEARGKPTTMADGSMIWDGFLIDITSRIEVEEELALNRERLKTATSILRHDIINDLTVIKSAVDIYREEQDETMLDEIEMRVWKSIETIHNQKDQMAFLDTHADLDEYDVKQVVQDVIKNYPDLEFKITGSGKAYADHALYSVFDNIVGNTKKHGKTNKLDIDINCDEQYCEIRFADHGIGIPDEIKARVFDEGFYYGETGHTGIGLYVVKRTIEEYGGEVFVEDNIPKGVMFVIRLNKTIDGF